MTREEIVERLRKASADERGIGSKSPPDIRRANWTLELVERAGLCVIPAEPSEAEVERVYNALCSRGKDPDGGDARAACEAVRTP